MCTKVQYEVLNVDSSPKNVITVCASHHVSNHYMFFKFSIVNDDDHNDGLKTPSPDFAHPVTWHLLYDAAFPLPLYKGSPPVASAAPSR